MTLKEDIQKDGFDNENQFFLYILLKLNFFSIWKPKVVYLHPFVSFLPFPKFLKENFMYFSHKHVKWNSTFLMVTS